MWGISGAGRKDKFKVNAVKFPTVTCSISFLLSDPADFLPEHNGTYPSALL